MKISSQVGAGDKAFKENYAHHLKNTEELHAKIAKAAQGGGEKSLARIKSQGKLTARERIHKLIDQDSEFLELSRLAGEGLYEDNVPGGGVLTGIGVVSGRTCL